MKLPAILRDPITFLLPPIDPFELGGDRVKLEGACRNWRDLAFIFMGILGLIIGINVYALIV